MLNLQFLPQFIFQKCRNNSIFAVAMGTLPMPGIFRVVASAHTWWMIFFNFVSGLAHLGIRMMTVR